MVSLHAGPLNTSLCPFSYQRFMLFFILEVVNGIILGLVCWAQWEKLCFNMFTQFTFNITWLVHIWLSLLFFIPAFLTYLRTLQSGNSRHPCPHLTNNCMDGFGCTYCGSLDSVKDLEYPGKDMFNKVRLVLMDSKPTATHLAALPCGCWCVCILK